MQVELKHTWRVSRRAWYIRLYCWLWGASERDITFCKLWWGYVFIIPALLFRLVFYPIVWLLFKPLELTAQASVQHFEAKGPCIYAGPRRRAGKHITLGISRAKHQGALWYIEGDDDYSIKRTLSGESFKWRFRQPGTYKVKAALDGGPTISYELVIKPPSQAGMAILNFFSMLPTRISFVLDPIVRSKPVKLARRGLKLGWVGVCIAGVVGLLGVCGLAIYEGVVHADTWTGAVASGISAFAGGVWSVAPYIGMGLAIAALFMALLILFMRDEVQHGVKKGAVTFGEAMRIGYTSVKSNTCPRVELED